MYPGDAQASFDYNTQLHKTHLLSLFLSLTENREIFATKKHSPGKINKKAVPAAKSVTLITNNQVVGS